MKKLLVMLIVATCAIAWRSPDIMHAIGAANSAQDPGAIALKSVSATQAAQKPISMEEFARMSKTDPKAYEKLLNSYGMRERSEVDKLMNLLAHGRYE